ncbi:hypothetical protein LY78DRAFT_685009 [Colletotrichum sublineola]|nr:hypothetical protein LY78DRAFT_685009 [Colletotrichum sublineola]
MPQIDQEDAKPSCRIITNMVDVACRLSGFLPRSKPKYLPASSTLHTCGTYRAGTSQGDSVVDSVGRVWGQDNLLVASRWSLPKEIIKDLNGVKAIKRHTV